MVYCFVLLDNGRVLPALLLDMHELLVLGFTQCLANLLDLQLALMFL
jgi:hypothetical protein